MTRVIGLAVALGFGSAGLGGAQEPPAADRQWAALVDDLDRSVIAGDAQGMTAARDAARRGLEEAPRGAAQARLRYLLAYANWRLLGANPAPDGDERDALADEAESMLRANLDVRDDDVEAHALLGAVYGMKIGSSIWRGMTRAAPRPDGGAATHAAFDEQHRESEMAASSATVTGCGWYSAPRSVP